MANEIDEIAREAKRYVNAPVTAPAAAVSPRNVDISRPFEQRIGSAPYSNPNVQGGLLSAEAASYQASRGAGAAAAGTGAAEAAAPAAQRAASPLAQAATAAGQKFSQAAGATMRAQIPSVPPVISGAISKMASGAAGATTGALGSIGAMASKVAPWISPVIEGGRVIQVAADPNATKGDVVQQGVEGAARTGAVIGGSALGAGLGSFGGPLAPATIPIGAAAGGIAGYFGGDAAINKMRSMLGLGEKSPVQASNDRIAATAPNAAYQPARLTSDANRRVSAGALNAPSGPIAAEAQQAPMAAPAAAPEATQPGARIRAVAPSQPRAQARPAAAAVPGQPSADDGSVKVIRGMETTVAVPGVNGGPMVEVPLAVYEAGKVGDYRSAKAKAAIANAQNPEQLKNESRLSEVAAENVGRLGVAGITAGASKYNTDANIAARRDELKNNVVYSDETVTDDMGGTKVVRRAFKPDGTPITAPAEKKPTLDVATNQAQNAVKAGADKNAVNAILQGYGYPPIK